MIDVHNAWVTMLPIVPTDIFPRDLSELLHKKYHRIKTTFDLTCLITTVLLSLLILHHLYGIGIGTFFCAFMTGRTVSLVQKFIGNHVEFYRLMKKEMVMHLDMPWEGDGCDYYNIMNGVRNFSKYMLYSLYIDSIIDEFDILTLLRSEYFGRKGCFSDNSEGVTKTE